MRRARFVHLASLATHYRGFTQESISSLAFNGAAVQSVGLVKKPHGRPPFRSAGSPKNVSVTPVILAIDERGMSGTETLRAYPAEVGRSRDA